MHMQKIYEELQEYLEENNLAVRYIAPILNDGHVIGESLNKKLEHYNAEIINMNYKYDHSQKIPVLSRGDNDASYLPIEDNEVIVLADFNVSTGFTSSVALMHLKKRNPNAKVIMATLTADYTTKTELLGFEAFFNSIYNNETQGLTSQECEELGIKDLIYINYNQDINEELECANFCPVNHTDEKKQIVQMSNKKRNKARVTLSQWFNYLRKKLSIKPKDTVDKVMDDRD